MKKYLIVVFVMLCAGTSMAEIPNAFYERFNFVKNEGKLVEIKDKSMGFGFQVSPYLKLIKKMIKNEQMLMKSKSDYYGEVESLLTEESLKMDEKSNQNVKIVLDSLKEIEKVDIDAIFSNVKFKNFIAKFENKMKIELAKLNPTVLVNTQDPTYFYKRKVTYQVVKWGLGLAKKIFSNVPILNTASYVLVKIEKLVRERREFHQNLLMHYMENHESDLELSKEDVDLAYSSIYESRIQWFAFWESSSAKQNWSKYGVNKFFTSVRAANTTLRANRTRYSRSGKRINYAFQVVREKDENVIVNLFDRENLFNSKPATAYYVDQPNKMVRKRIIMQLAGLGISFLPLPSFIKNIGDSYIKSTYEKQKITEGALFGYFESQANNEGMDDIIGQYMNPFDTQLKL